MKIVYVICRCIINLAFMALSVFLFVYTHNPKWIWLLCVPIVSHLLGMID